jgi:hypothetical protein
MFSEEKTHKKTTKKTTRKRIRKGDEKIDEKIEETVTEETVTVIRPMRMGTAEEKEEDQKKKSDDVKRQEYMRAAEDLSFSSYERESALTKIREDPNESSNGSEAEGKGEVEVEKKEKSFVCKIGLIKSLTKKRPDFYQKLETLKNLGSKRITSHNLANIVSKKKEEPEMKMASVGKNFMSPKHHRNMQSIKRRLENISQTLNSTNLKDHNSSKDLTEFKTKKKAVEAIKRENQANKKLKKIQLDSKEYKKNLKNSGKKTKKILKYLKKPRGQWPKENDTRSFERTLVNGIEKKDNMKEEREMLMNKMRLKAKMTQKGVQDWLDKKKKNFVLNKTNQDDSVYSIQKKPRGKGGLYNKVNVKMKEKGNCQSSRKLAFGKPAVRNSSLRSFKPNSSTRERSQYSMSKIKSIRKSERKLMRKTSIMTTGKKNFRKSHKKRGISPYLSPRFLVRHAARASHNPDIHSKDQLKNSKVQYNSNNSIRSDISLNSKIQRIRMSKKKLKA